MLNIDKLEGKTPHITVTHHFVSKERQPLSYFNNHSRIGTTNIHIPAIANNSAQTDIILRAPLSDLTFRRRYQNRRKGRTSRPWRDTFIHHFFLPLLFPPTTPFAVRPFFNRFIHEGSPPFLKRLIEESSSSTPCTLGFAARTHSNQSID